MDRLNGIVREYDWGDLDALAGILRRRPSGRPEAEYWLGAHPSGTAVLASTGQPLDRAIASDPDAMLGSDLASGGGQLPFLLKILAARRALSIQAHPSAAQAAAGFAKEDAAGVARDARQRTYRDPNHKPELICALTPFEARCGFRDQAATLELLDRFGQRLAPVGRSITEVGPADTALWLLGLPPEQAEPLALAAVEIAGERLTAASPAGRATDGALAEFASAVEVGAAFPGDVGVVVALLLNHVVLEPGQALFLGAGNVHAYLKGVGVEVMASSDNVIRGGLTAKHIDVAELAAVVDRRPGPVPIQTPAGPIHTFETPVPDFSLTRIDTSERPGRTHRRPVVGARDRPGHLRVAGGRDLRCRHRAGIGGGDLPGPGRRTTAPRAGLRWGRGPVDHGLAGHRRALTGLP